MERNPTITTMGNSVVGTFTTTQTGSESNSLWQTNADATSDYELSGDSSRGYTITNTFSAVTGESSASETGSDDYSLVEIGDTATKTFTQTLTGTDN